MSGDHAVAAPIRITQDATLRVARIENATIAHDFAPRRYGFLFVGNGSVEVNGEVLGAGDSVRLYDFASLVVGGNGELVLWDLPQA